MKALFIDQLASGEFAVPICVLKEFRELYEEEAAELESIIKVKLVTKPAYHAGAASVAEKLNSGFPRGPYDQSTNLYTAAIAISEGLQLITSTSELSRYNGIGCNVSDLTTWAKQN